jgi:hypothetical protein
MSTEESKQRFVIAHRYDSLSVVCRDVAVLEVGGRHWLSPAPASGTGPASRAFHCATAVGRSLFLFGGHVYVKEKRGLQKFNDMWALDTVWCRLEIVCFQSGMIAICER